ncbi:asparagine--tRNA ligase, chloroplastic/mitochondrial [Tanacetum coccineum]|uniref:asparagine--tRNA ligase n=1 Tax=Tanacetum coccineum TaxID=301880 RepID=A0ABQ4WD10_9ASTR
MATAALSPATVSLRLKPLTTTLRFLSTYHHHHNHPNNLKYQLITIPSTHTPKLTYNFNHLTNSRPQRRCFSISATVSTGETLETSKTDKIGEFKKRLRIVDIKGGRNEGLDKLGQVLTVRGWVRTLRVQSSVTFIEVNDGSCLSNMQCVIDSDAEGYDQVESGLITTGASVCVEGLVVPSQGKKQKIELKIQKLVTVGKSDPSFPIQKKKVTREFLRSKAHLRPRTNTFGAVARVRNALAYATHKFFQENGFVWVASPIITASDCEGAGEQFCVTTLIPSSREASESRADAIPKTESGLIDWSQDFFEKPAFLTVSGQLNGETYATALTDVYTFGPTFRAENSNTSRHLAEFWMIEPELAFADLNDDMACATAYLQTEGVKHVLENCKEDMDFFNNWIEKGIIDRLSDVVEKKKLLSDMTYTDAVELLLKSKKKFEFPNTVRHDISPVLVLV